MPPHSSRNAPPSPAHSPAGGGPLLEGAEPPGAGRIGTVGGLMVLWLGMVQLASVGLPLDGRERRLLG